MKRLTFIAFGIAGTGFLISLIERFLDFRILDGLGPLLTSVGIAMLYVFFTAWQAEINKTRLIITLFFSGFITLTLLIFAFIKANDAEKQKVAAQEYQAQFERQITEAVKKLRLLSESLKNVVKSIK